MTTLTRGQNHTQFGDHSSLQEKLTWWESCTNDAKKKARPHKKARSRRSQRFCGQALALNKSHLATFHHVGPLLGIDWVSHVWFDGGCF